jgi:hypothetical protein
VGVSKLLTCTVYLETSQLHWCFFLDNCVTLTETKRSHLSILCVHLRDVSHPLTQHIHWDLITVLVLAVGCLVTSPLDLGLAVSWTQMNRSRLQSLLHTLTNAFHKVHILCVVDISTLTCFLPVIPKWHSQCFLWFWISVWLWMASTSVSFGRDWRVHLIAYNIT